MISVPRCSLFDDRIFQYGPACAVASNSNRLLVYYPLGSGKTLAAIHGARVFLDGNPDGKLVVLTTLSNVDTTWKNGIKMYRSATGDVHKRAFKKAMIHNPDWWYSKSNTSVSHYNKIMNHLSENGYTRQSLQTMTPNELLRACEQKSVRREFLEVLKEGSDDDKRRKRLSMLQATIPTGKYCLIVDECQEYINVSAQSNLVNALCKAASTVLLLSATPVHDSYRYSGLKRLLDNPRSLVRSCIWTSYSVDVPTVSDPGPEFALLDSEEWAAHKRADRSRNSVGASENAYLTKSRQKCNCESKWLLMADKIEEDISSAEGIVRIVVYSFFRSNGVDGFFQYLRTRWGATVQNKRLQHVIDGNNVRVSMRHEKTLKWFNKEGLEVKILLLTSKDGVGISLKNVRWFHLMEPQWSDADDQQAIGRATRTHSHTMVEPVVRVYRWIARSPLHLRDKTADQKVRASMNEKKKRTDKLLTKMAEAGGKYLEELLLELHIE